MKIAQHYKVLGKGFDTDSTLRPAQFIADKDHTIIGFISKVNACSIDIVTFTPEVIDEDNTLVIQETLERGKVQSFLRDALQTTPEMIEDWRERFGTVTD